MSAEHVQQSFTSNRTSGPFVNGALTPDSARVASALCTTFRLGVKRNSGLTKG